MTGLNTLLLLVLAIVFSANADSSKRQPAYNSKTQTTEPPLASVGDDAQPVSIIVAGVASFVLIVVGIVLYRNRSTEATYRLL